MDFLGQCQRLLWAFLDTQSTASAHRRSHMGLAIGTQGDGPGRTHLDTATTTRTALRGHCSHRSRPRQGSLIPHCLGPRRWTHWRGGPGRCPYRLSAWGLTEAKIPVTTTSPTRTSAPPRHRCAPFRRLSARPPRPSKPVLSAQPSWPPRTPARASLNSAFRRSKVISLASMGNFIQSEKASNSSTCSAA